MIEVTTGNRVVGERTWRVEVSWQQRKALMAVGAMRYGGTGTLTIDTDAMLGVIYPDCIADAPGEAEFWALPGIHHEDLALAVGYWLWTGRELRTDTAQAGAGTRLSDDNGGEEDEEGRPLVAQDW